MVQGQVPKRSDQRRRNNPPMIPVKSGPANPCRAPRANSEWHPIARRWYNALPRSGQSVYYEPSDWATAYLVAESLSRSLFPRYVAMRTLEDGSSTPVYASVPVSGADLTAYLRAMTALCVMEGDRRRASIELRNDGSVDADEIEAENELEVFKARRARTS